MLFLLPIIGGMFFATAVALHPADRRRFNRRRATVEHTATIAPPAPRPVALDGPIIKQLVWAPAAQPATADGARRFPTLDVIDRARGAAGQPFATDPDAASLEMRARELANEHWSELVWLTGLVDETRFNALCAALENTRTLSGQDVGLVVVRELEVQAHEIGQ